MHSIETSDLLTPDKTLAIPKDKFTILLIDDLRENLISLEKLLEGKNRHFLKVTSGSEALELVEKHPEIGLILLDVHMPGLSGFEVAKVLNSNPNTCNIPFLFVTANQIEDKNILEGFEKGAVDYLIKPLNPVITRAKVAVFEKLYLQQLHLKKTIAERDRVNAQLERYTKVMAHDLKTPLAGMISLISLIRINERVQDIDDVIEELSLLETLSCNLSDMITSVLQDSRNINDDSVQRISIEHLIEKCINLLQAPDCISFIIEKDLPVLRTRVVPLQQVFQNLIGNAIKYNDKSQGLIGIGCSDAGNFFKFHIKDNGPGIPPADIGRIFDEYVTGTAESHRDSSTGVGLNLVKTIIEEHGGKIWVESSVDEGSTFFFLWPK